MNQLESLRKLTTVVAVVALIGRFVMLVSRHCVVPRRTGDSLSSRPGGGRVNTIPP